MRSSSFLSPALAVAAVLAPAVSRAGPCPARSNWPVPDWTSTASQVAVSKASAVQALETYAFTLTGADADRVGIRTDSVIVVKGGNIIYERYARGYTASTPHESWSVAKSVTNALAGVAVGQGALSISDSVCTYFPSAAQDHCEISVQNLLEFTSGLQWYEDYENASYQLSSVLAMLYGEGREDMSAFVLKHPFAHTPGTFFNYSTGEITLLAGLVDEAMKKVTPDATWPWKLLFTPIGITSAVFETDPAGHRVGGAYFYATPRDYARFGYLYLNQGCWQGNRILPANWVRDTVQPTAVSSGQQGRLWWLNQTNPATWPDVPVDAYAAEGHWGQFVVVIPSLDLVIVRTGDDRDDTFDLTTFIKLAMAVAS